MNDPNGPDFTAAERNRWNDVAAGWRRWWQVFEHGAHHVNEVLVQLARVAPGHRVLDVATGLGEPALTAARVVGPGGRVVGCDLADAMIAEAAARAAAAGIGHAEFVAQDAQELDLGGEVFDAALCRWGLMLMARPLAAATRIHAALRPGAHFAAAVWRGPEQVPLIALPGQVLDRVLGPAPTDPGAPGPFRMQGDDDLPALLRAAGFTDIRCHSALATLEFDAPATFASFSCEMSSRVRAALHDADPATGARIRSALAAAVSAFIEPDGRVRLRNHALCAVGRRG